ncbi:hypothetical protein HOLDEFILI_00246 [Holdemania filiformis DSM 12042]|uniref:Uncharacterized protein n=1 Tax=Holdemania filiformis DSM 12042 TaxID=545696 RepID=B9Y371_9FIRM|nr:hypothetical protein HOLDEFILI_00246 [Holdemania filiformis DSM 12042]
MFSLISYYISIIIASLSYKIRGALCFCHKILYNSLKRNEDP